MPEVQAELFGPDAGVAAFELGERLQQPDGHVGCFGEGVVL